jgi:glyoxylase-like metal-dependent hydrolase (beta-lactamase superfamily II)
MAEELLRGLGIWRIELPIPFPGETVNAYAIEDDGGGLALVDTGVATPQAEAAWSAALARIGRSFADITRIIVTHAHPDHFGGARGLVERAWHGVPVYAHPRDLPKIDAAGPAWSTTASHLGAQLVKHGTPALHVGALTNGGSAAMEARPIGVLPLNDGEVLRFARFQAKVLHLPGHTPGLICLHDPGSGVLLSNDHVLQNVTPYSMIEPGPNGEEDYFRPLVEYLASLERTRTLAVRLVLPGHGLPFEDHRQVIDWCARAYAHRQARICEELASGPRTAWDLTTALYPRLRANSAIPAVSQTVANLEVLERGRRVARVPDEGVYRWELVADSEEEP